MPPHDFLTYYEHIHQLTLIKNEIRFSLDNVFFETGLYLEKYLETKQLNL